MGSNSNDDDEDKIQAVLTEISNMQKNLICGICLEVMTDPQRTRCGHSYCLKCINNWLRNNSTAAKSSKCPSCNTNMNRRALSQDSTMAQCIDQFQILNDAVKKDIAISKSAKAQQELDKSNEDRSNCEPSTSKMPDEKAGPSTIIIPSSDDTVIMNDEEEVEDKSSSKNPEARKNCDSPNSKVHSWLGSIEPPPEDEESRDSERIANSKSQLSPDPPPPPPAEERRGSSSNDDNNSRGGGGPERSMHSSSGSLEPPALTLETTKKTWTTVARFGKEMKSKQRQLKGLNVSIVNSSSDTSGSVKVINNNSPAKKTSARDFVTPGGKKLPIVAPRGSVESTSRAENHHQINHHTLPETPSSQEGRCSKDSPAARSDQHSARSNSSPTRESVKLNSCRQNLFSGSGCDRSSAAAAAKRIRSEAASVVHKTKGTVAFKKLGKIVDRQSKIIKFYYRGSLRNNNNTSAKSSNALPCSRSIQTQTDVYSSDGGGGEKAICGKCRCEGISRSDDAIAAYNPPRASDDVVSIPSPGKTKGSSSDVIILSSASGRESPDSVCGSTPPRQNKSVGRKIVAKLSADSSGDDEANVTVVASGAARELSGCSKRKRSSQDEQEDSQPMAGQVEEIMDKWHREAREGDNGDARKRSRLSIDQTLSNGEDFYDDVIDKAYSMRVATTSLLPMPTLDNNGDEAMESQMARIDTEEGLSMRENQENDPPPPQPLPQPPPQGSTSPAIFDTEPDMFLSPVPGKVTPSSSHHPASQQNFDKENINKVEYDTLQEVDGTPVSKRQRHGRYTRGNRNKTRPPTNSPQDCAKQDSPAIIHTQEPNVYQASLPRENLSNVAATTRRESNQSDPRGLATNCEQQPDSLMDVTAQENDLRLFEADVLGLKRPSAKEQQQPMSQRKSPPKKRQSFRNNETLSQNASECLQSSSFTRGPSVDYRETTPADFPTLNEDNDFATTPRPVFTSTQIDADTTVPSECPKYNSTPKSTAKRAGGGGREADKYVFMCSGLVRNEQEDVQELALRIDGEFVAGYRASVTHVIVRVNEENRTGKTLKYLQGVAHRLWVVGYQWVVDCKQHGRLLPEEQYEALDDTGEPGPKKSRLRETQLFRDYTFNFAEAPTHISMEDIQDLVVSTGGSVTKNVNDLVNCRDKLKVVVINETSLGSITLKQVRGLYDGAKAIIITSEWIIDSIGSYKLASLLPFLVGLLPEEVSKLGFPEELLIDENSTLESLATNTI